MGQGTSRQDWPGPGDTGNSWGQVWGDGSKWVRETEQLPLKKQQAQQAHSWKGFPRRRKNGSPEGRAAKKAALIELGTLKNAWHASWPRRTLRVSGYPSDSCLPLLREVGGGE